MDLIAMISLVGFVILLVLYSTKLYDVKGFTFGRSVVLGLLGGLAVAGFIISSSSIKDESTWKLTEVREISALGGFDINSKTGKVVAEIYNVPYCFFRQVKYVVLCNEEDVK